MIQTFIDLFYSAIRKYSTLLFTVALMLSISVISLPVSADVVWLENGEIILGEIVTAESDGITIKTFGEIRKVYQKKIIKSERTLENLKNKQSDITLKDGSVIKGKILDYDEEIGINVDIEFGNITLPVKSVYSITNHEQKKYHSGADINFGLTGGYYFLIGEASERFNNSLKLSIFAEFNTGLRRGLFAGADIAYTSLDYSGTENFSLSMYSIQPYLLYRFLGLRNSWSFMNRVVPFMSAGLGGAYITKKDNSESGLNEISELNITYSVKPGADIELINNLWLRVYTGFESVPQKNNSLHQIVFNSGVMYSF